MGMIKDRVIAAMEIRGIESMRLPTGWYVTDGSFHIGAGPFKNKDEAEKRIVSLDEKATFIDLE